jgi:hypothetical protein
MHPSFVGAVVEVFGCHSRSIKASSAMKLGSCQIVLVPMRDVAFSHGFLIVSNGYLSGYEWRFAAESRRGRCVLEPFRSLSNGAP